MDDILKAGWFAVNQRRVWCTLFVDRVEVSISPTDAKPKTQIPLSRLISVSTSRTSRNSIVLCSPDSTITLEAKNRIVMEDWVVLPKK